MKHGNIQIVILTNQKKNELIILGHVIKDF